MATLRRRAVRFLLLGGTAVAVTIGPTMLTIETSTPVCPNCGRSVCQRSRPPQPLYRQLQPPPSGASGPRPSSRCGSDHCLQGRSRMPVLLRELPRANDLGTVHTPRMTSAALLSGMPSSSETACRVPPSRRSRSRSRDQDIQRRDRGCSTRQTRPCTAGSGRADGRPVR